MNAPLSQEDSARTAFERAWRGVSAATDPLPVLAALRAAYAEPHRAYHTLVHVEACLAWLDWHWSLAEHPHEVALALWFHDAVYDPTSKDNEAKSAAWAVALLTEASVASDSVRRVEAMIHATRTHEARTEDEALLVSIDLAILGASPAAYARFERDVRTEYRAFDDATYAAGRVHVLENLAARAPLYPNAIIRAQLDRRARKNLEHAVAGLRATIAPHA